VTGNPLLKIIILFSISFLCCSVDPSRVHRCVGHRLLRGRGGHLSLPRPRRSSTQKTIVQFKFHGPARYVGKLGIEARPARIFHHTNGVESRRWIYVYPRDEMTPRDRGLRCFPASDLQHDERHKMVA
jgi:hypothetical protein